MSVISTNEKKNLIWGNIDINREDWQEGAIDFLKERGDELTEENIDKAIFDEINLNFEFMYGEMDIPLRGSILAVADIGTWKGRVMGYKVLKPNIKECFTGDYDLAEWYVDGYGNFRMKGIHHDGVNYVEYRMGRVEIEIAPWERFLNKIYYGKATREDILNYTVRLGDVFTDLYGWKYAGRVPNYKVVA